MDRDLKLKPKEAPMANDDKIQAVNDQSAYGFHLQLSRMDFSALIACVTEALKTQGFGVLTDIDVQATMKAKLGVDVQAYRILGACNPPLALQVLSADPDIGLLLPCNVVVRENPDGTMTVGFMDPIAVLKFTPHPKVAEVAQEVRQRLEAVRSAIAMQIRATAAAS